MRSFLRNCQFLIPLSFLVALLLSSCSESSSPDNSGSYAAIVTDEQSNPINGALVEALTSTNELIDSTRTNAQGAFTINNLPSDYSTVDLRFTANGFATYRESLKNIIQFSGVSKKIPLKLQSDTCCGRVELTIINHDSVALANVEVKLKIRDAQYATGRTDSTGFIVFENVCPGSYWFRLAKDGYNVKEEDFSLEECDTVRFTVRMTRTNTEEPDSCCHGKIILYLKDSTTNNALENVNVWLKKSGTVVREGRSGDNGRVVFENICPGEYRLYMSRDMYSEANYYFEMDCDDTLETTQYMAGICCNGIVRVNVTNGEGNNLNGAAVKLWKNGKLIRTINTENGYVIFRELCEGSYGFSIHKSGYQGLEFQTEVECDDSLTFDKTLTGGQDTCCTARLKVRVRPQGTDLYISGATVIFYQGDRAIDTVTTNQEGWAGRENLCAPGTYTVVVRMEGYVSREMSFTFEECNTIQETIWMEED